ncbi:MAG: hypothetical protein EXR58_04705 [Chloroflexi bacterium]|nr:hypothetical protein [Chloroflexota bacterium]
MLNHVVSYSLAMAVLLVAVAGCVAAPSRLPTDQEPESTDTPQSEVDVPAPSVDADIPAPSVGVGATCGRRRWPVKTLTDRDAARVNFAPIPASVEQLRALPVPRTLPQNSRNSPVELTTYSLDARILAFKLEDDRDIHVKISALEDTSLTMIVEFPDAKCSGAIASARAADIRSARAALVGRFGEPSAQRFRDLSGVGTFTGVGFFDELHGQNGVAPNGIEIHPVLAFSAN